MVLIFFINFLIFNFLLFYSSKFIALKHSYFIYQKNFLHHLFLDNYYKKTFFLILYFLERFWYFHELFFAVFPYFFIIFSWKFFRHFYRYEKKIIRNIFKKKLKRIDLKMSFLSFSFIMIYIIHKMLVLLKNNLNYLKDNAFKCFLRSIIDFSKKLFFYNI